MHNILPSTGVWWLNESRLKKWVTYNWGLGLRSPGLKLGVENSGVGMSCNRKKDPETSQAKTLFSCIWAQYDVNYVQYWKNFSSLLSSILPPYFRNRSSLIRILVYILQLVSSTMSNFWKTILVYMISFFLIELDYLTIYFVWLPFIILISYN